jgi:cohesin complex subunit SA-1/2
MNIPKSFTLVLEGVVRTEEHAVALAKLLVSCLVVRGAQLSIVKRLESDYVVNIHTNLLTWIGKRLSAYEANKNKKLKNTSILFFRALVPLLSSVESRDALRMCVV